MKKNQYDFVVIGGGHNGLTAACTLGKRGRKVLVLERAAQVGGMAAGEEFFPGFRSAGLLHDTSLVRTGIVDSLALERFGLKYRGEDPPVFIPTRDPGKKGLLLHYSADRAKEEIATWSSKDAAAYGEYRKFFERTRSFFDKVFNDIPPPLASMSFPGLWEVMKKAISLRMLGKTDMLEILRIGPMCVADWLGEWFETDIMRAALAGPAIYGTYMGPWSPSSNANLLIDGAMHQKPIDGGSPSLVAALKKAAQACGVEIRCSSEVKKITIEGKRATGVILSNDEFIAAGTVAASCDPKTVFLNMIDSHHLSQQFEHRISKFRARGTTAKVHLAIRGKLSFACRPDLEVERARTGEHVDELERAFDPVKYREFAKEPVLDILVPSVASKGFAPEQHSSVSILVNFAPYDLNGGWNEANKQELEGTVVDHLQKYVPTIKSQILATEVLTPKDIEERYGANGGHIHHGEHAPDQLLVRPSPECSQYSSPFSGLFLCGSGTHPGGGLTCAPGALAALTMLKNT